MDRRAAMGQFGVAAAVVAGFPALASADGAVSTATVNRARGIYGGRVAALEAAVKKGDFAAVAGEKNAFILFNSGAYPGIKNKGKKSAAISSTNAIFAAIKGKDAAGLKTAYASYVSANGIKATPVVNVEDGQGFGNDFDFRARTTAG